MILIILSILWSWQITNNGQAIQIGEILTNNQNIKIMKMNFNNPALLQSAGAKPSIVDWGSVFNVTAIEDVTLNFTSQTKYGVYREQIEYSTNGVDYIPLPESISIKSGKSVGFKVLQSRLNEALPIFESTGKINVAGRLLNAISHDGLHSGEEGLFKQLFKGIPVVDASRLTLENPFYGSSGWYSELFMNCTDLKYAPNEILVAGLGGSPKSNLLERTFYGCSSLLKSPIINASTLTSTGGAFNELFFGCSSLSEITISLGFTPSSIGTDWVSGVAPTGVFISNVQGIESGSNGIPEGWTVIEQ